MGCGLSKCLKRKLQLVNTNEPANKQRRVGSSGLASGDLALIISQLEATAVDIFKFSRLAMYHRPGAVFVGC